MNKPEILALTDEKLRIKAAELDGAKWYACKTVKVLEFGRPLGWHEASDDEMGLDLGEAWNSNIPDYPNDISAAFDLFESVYRRGGKIKGGSWVLSTVDGGRDVASATLFWKAKSGHRHRANKVQVIRPRGEMAKAITQCWVCAMLGVSDG